MKKRFFASLLLTCALTVPFVFSACDWGEKAPEGEGGGGSVTDPSGGSQVPDVTDELKAALAQLLTEGNVTPEIQLFVAHYKDFTLKDGKYTCAEIESVNGFTCKNIEIELESKKISKVTYELRTASKETPDRIITIDKDGVKKTDVPKPSDDKPMDEEEWTEQATVFADVTNYTLERVRVESGDYVASMMLDGDTYYESIDLAETIYDIENNKYYRYHRAPNTREWVKTEVDSKRYLNITGTPSLMVTVAAKAVQENFSNFTFEGGVYTAAELKVKYFYEFTLKDMQITVSGGKIVRAVCILVGGYDDEGDERITVDHIGSTEIEIPEQFTDNTAPTPSGDGTVDEKKWKEQFSAENFTLVATPDGFVVEQGTFSVDGKNLEIDQKSDDIEYGGHLKFIWENEAYQVYVFYAASPVGQNVWMKVPSESFGGDNAAKSLESYKALFTLFLNDFSNFTLKDGKYTRADCTKELAGPGGTNEVACTDIEAVFNEEGKLVSFKFTATATVDGKGQTTVYEFKEIGTTVVRAPDEYFGA